MRTHSRILLSLMAVGAASASQAFMYEQPYSPKISSFTSIVRSCNFPRPTPLAAADDFNFDLPGTDVTINTIVWWGNLFSNLQFGRRYYVAIYKESGFCLPALSSLVYRACVKPEETFDSVDCQLRRVWRFKAPLPPVTLDGGGHYWLQISESDADSANPGFEDFRWSGYRPVTKCPAVQFDAFGGFIQPLIDDCDGEKDDLAFGLYG